MKRAIYNKYSLVRYYSTELTRVTNYGGVFIQPLFFEFPNESDAVLFQQRNLMIGQALKLGINSDTLG